MLCDIDPKWILSAGAMAARESVRKFACSPARAAELRAHMRDGTIRAGDSGDSLGSPKKESRDEAAASAVDEDEDDAYCEAVRKLDGTPAADASTRALGGSNTMDTIGYAQEMEDCIAILVSLAMQSARPGCMGPVLDLLPILLLPNGAFDVTPILALLSRIFPSYAPAALRRALLKTSRDILSGQAQARPLAAVTSAEAREKVAKLALEASKSGSSSAAESSSASKKKAAASGAGSSDADGQLSAQRRLPARNGLPQFLLGIQQPNGLLTEDPTDGEVPGREL